MDGINSARGDDTSSLKSAIVKYILEDTRQTIDPAILANNKSDRGWNHPLTAELLCPLEWEPSDTCVYFSCCF